MKFKALFAALLLTSLAGCANQAVVTLQDGSEVLVKDQSDYDKYNDYYEFEQLNGDTILIKKDKADSTGRRNTGLLNRF
ncbi:YgdI/YgdR family lipoprotein [Pseudomonas aeruginosa]|uniref:YgdI/YgdR family lipoprotein n=1 Tax=Pseudomonas aeruginosa TaxID=287 RepID=UPI000E316432|nr:YgdI/YgdR family lipoprotein [Pseudomonas aeruginosa]NQB43523.1 YgdI/YgdR family lipoprotein [Pseudomonas aeruginosa]